MMKSMTRIGAAVGAAILTVGLGAAALSIAGDQQNQPPAADGRRGGPFDSAQGRPGGFGPGRGRGPMGPLGGLPLRELNLTESQREQVRTIVESRRVRNPGDRRARDGGSRSTARGHDVAVVRRRARADQGRGSGRAGRRPRGGTRPHLRRRVPDPDARTAGDGEGDQRLATAPTERTAVDDVRRGDPEAVEQLFRLAAAGNLAHGQAVDADAGLADGLGHGVADAASRVVILDGDDAGRRSRVPAAIKRRRDRSARPSRDR